MPGTCFVLLPTTLLLVLLLFWALQPSCLLRCSSLRIPSPQPRSRTSQSQMQFCKGTTVLRRTSARRKATSRSRVQKWLDRSPMCLSNRMNQRRTETSATFHLREPNRLSPVTPHCLQRRSPQVRMISLCLLAGRLTKGRRSVRTLRATMSALEGSTLADIPEPLWMLMVHQLSTRNRTCCFIRAIPRLLGDAAFVINR